MKKQVLAAAGVFVIVLLFWKGGFFSKSNIEHEQMNMGKAEQVASYWTCPMHPQIHLDHPGECPICHMKLVQVKAKNEHTTHSESENRSAVMVSPDQMHLLGVQKIQVERMDLVASIPVAGRFISPSTVAFQVYESDLRYVKRGLSFTGENSFSPEAEINGTISSVDNIVDPTSRTVRVLGVISKGPPHIIPETTFRGDIAIRLKNVVVIPESSVLHTGNGDLVYLIHEEGHLEAQTVRLGMKSESYYEVLSGLEPDQFISSGPNFLIDSEAKIRGASQTNDQPSNRSNSQSKGELSGHTHH